MQEGVLHEPTGGDDGEDDGGDIPDGGNAVDDAIVEKEGKKVL